MPSHPSRLPALAVPPMAEYACSEVEFRMGTPSITYSGWLSLATERIQRILTLAEAPRPEET